MTLVKEAVAMNRKVLLLMVLMTAGFGAAGLLAADSPAAVVRAVYMNCNAGQYSKVERLLSADLQKLLHSQVGVINGGVKGLCDENTHHGTMTALEIVSEDVKGEGAKVLVNIHFKNGKTTQREGNWLILENGSWKVTVAD
jgi:hypothetical protein